MFWADVDEAVVVALLAALPALLVEELVQPVRLEELRSLVGFVFGKFSAIKAYHVDCSSHVALS